MVKNKITNDEVRDMKNWHHDKYDEVSNSAGSAVESMGGSGTGGIGFDAMYRPQEELWKSRAGGVYIPNHGALRANDAIGKERFWGTAQKGIDLSLLTREQ